MGSLGDLGTPRPPIELDFGYFGETIRVDPDATDLDVADMMASFGHVDDETQAGDVMTGLRDQLVKQVHPDDRALFWETAKANRQQLRDIMAVSKAITEAVAGFPTGQSSDSSTGPTSTVDSSEGALSNRESRRAASREIRHSAVSTIKRDKAVERALSALDGRPDLQLGLLQLHGQMPHPEEEATG